MKNLLLAVVLIICIGVMAYTDSQIISQTPYPSLSRQAK